MPGIRRSVRHKFKLLSWLVAIEEAFLIDYAKVFLHGRGEKKIGGFNVEILYML